MTSATLKLLSIALLLSAASCKKGDSATTTPLIPEPEPIRVVYAWDKFAMGADLSYVNEVEANGGVYKDSSKIKDVFDIFKTHGANVVRVRLWHNPQWMAPYKGGNIYSNLKDVEETILRAKNAGMAVNLDFHYSDEWTDPGKQYTPAAWKDLPLDLLKDSVYTYTLHVLTYLKGKNLTPEMVQVGNEVNQGMLWPVGSVTNDASDWKPFGTLLNSGIKAVRDFSATSTIKPQIILHIAKVTDTEWCINNLMTKGGVTDFDIIGISHYYLWSSITSMDQVTSTIRGLRTKHNKKVMIVEVCYPWTTQNADSYPNVISGNPPFGTYSISKENQFKFLKDLTQKVIDGGGSGMMYWDPAWLSTPQKDKWGTGSSWDNNTLFDFSGNALPGLDYMTQPYQF